MASVLKIEIAQWGQLVRMRACPSLILVAALDHHGPYKYLGRVPVQNLLKSAGLVHPINRNEPSRRLLDGETGQNLQGTGWPLE